MLPPGQQQRRPVIGIVGFLNRLVLDAVIQLVARLAAALTSKNVVLLGVPRNSGPALTHGFRSNGRRLPWRVRCESTAAPNGLDLQVGLLPGSCPPVKQRRSTGHRGVIWGTTACSRDVARSQRLERRRLVAGEYSCRRRRRSARGRFWLLVAAAARDYELKNQSLSRMMRPPLLMSSAC